MVEDKPSVSHLRMVIANRMGGIIASVRQTEISEYDTSGFPEIEEMITGPVCETIDVVRKRANKNSL
jgi:hypothetical protein